MYFVECSNVHNQGRGKYLKLGGAALRGHFFRKKKGAFLKIEKGTSLFISKSWGGYVPPVSPRFLRLCTQ